MTFLTPDDIPATFRAAGFGVSLEHAWYRIALVLAPKHASRQGRVGARPPTDVIRFADFVRGLNQLLPTKAARLFWIAHWQDWNYGADDAFLLAARRGLGETRSLAEAPGLLLGAHDYDREDQEEVTSHHAADLALLTGHITQVLASTSDAWLIAEGSSDRIELWEGNLFFHSADPAARVRAEALFDRFECPRELI